MRQAAMPNTTVTSTFILRFWREQAGAESRWRGRIEHVQSGRRIDFLSVDQMLAFLQQMGVTCIQLADGDKHETTPQPTVHTT